MTNPISAIRPPAPIAADNLAGAPPRSSGAGFEDALKEAFRGVDALQKNAQSSMEGLLRGESEDLHKIALDHQRAALAFDLFLQMRNKAVTAYQEIMRMQV
ncbi:MAG: flagellar hook-basal body complex protein FliE [Candidatus Solibacter sp.]|nr:flagellar hook-basal body complex protein FliE [Candidatus Solibacter sp.]